MKVLYTAEATAYGGREGRVRTSDGALMADLAIPKELGGPGGPATNPEQRSRWLRRPTRYVPIPTRSAAMSRSRSPSTRLPTSSRPHCRDAPRPHERAEEVDRQLVEAFGACTGTQWSTPSSRS